MVPIVILYLVLVWLAFSKLKLIRWGWVSGTAKQVSRSGCPFRVIRVGFTMSELLPLFLR
jgi:hypothetical protein